MILCRHVKNSTNLPPGSRSGLRRGKGLLDIREALLPQPPDPSNTAPGVKVDLIRLFNQVLRAIGTARKHSAYKLAEGMHRHSLGMPQLGAVWISNAILARFQAAQAEIPPKVFCDACLEAVKENLPHTLYLYLQIPKQRPESQPPACQLKLYQWKEIVASIVIANNRLMNSIDHFTDGPSNFSRHRKTWAIVITGGRHLPESSGETTYGASLYDTFVALGMQGLGLYLELILTFLNQADITRLCHKDLAGENTDLGPEEANFMLNSYIQLFLAKEFPQMAWSLVRDKTTEVSRIWDSTWKVLCQHPTFIETWHPSLNQSAIDSLCRELTAIEEILNVGWSGGENGSHIFREDAALINACERDILTIEETLGVKWTGGENGYHEENTPVIQREGGERKWKPASQWYGRWIGSEREVNLYPST